MNFISRDTDYAVRALIFMAEALKKDIDIVTVDEIVKEEKLPKIFLRRILQRLAKKKILRSYKGKDGGFSFLRKPAKIRFTDVLEIFQGKVDLTNCLLRGRICPNIARCRLRKKLKELSRSLDRELRKITIASLLKR